MNFIKSNARIFAMLVVAIMTFFIGDGIDFTSVETFFVSLFTNFTFTVGAALTVLTGYIGERRLIDIVPNQTLTAASAILTVLLPIIAGGVDWQAFLSALNIFASTGQLTYGALIGVLINYFADIRIGRPVPNSSAYKANSYAKFSMSDMVPMIFTPGKYRQ